VRTYLEEQQTALAHWLDSEDGEEYDEEEYDKVDEAYAQEDTDCLALPAISEEQA